RRPPPPVAAWSVGGIEEGQRPAHPLVAEAVPLRIPSADDLAGAELAGAGPRLPAAHGAAVVGRVGVVGLDVVDARAGAQELRVAVADRRPERHGEAAHVVVLRLARVEAE